MCVAISWSLVCTRNFGAPHARMSTMHYYTTSNYFIITDKSINSFSIVLAKLNIQNTIFKNIFEFVVKFSLKFIFTFLLLIYIYFNILSITI